MNSLVRRRYPDSQSSQLIEPSSLALSDDSHLNAAVNIHGGVHDRDVELVEHERILRIVASFHLDLRVELRSESVPLQFVLCVELLLKHLSLFVDNALVDLERLGQVNWLAAEFFKSLVFEFDSLPSLLLFGGFLF